MKGNNYLMITIVTILIIVAGLTIYFYYPNNENQAPIVNAGDDQFIDVGQYISFEGTAFDPDGEITLYEWDLNGDGIFDWSSNNQSIVDYYHYNQSGTYDVLYRVRDDKGAFASDTIQVTVSTRFDFKISANKTQFTINELCNITISITNMKEAIEISEPSFGFGGIEFIIYDDNEIIISRELPILPGIPDSLTLDKDETFVDTYTLNQKDYPLYLLNAGSEYEISCRYRSDYSTNGEVQWQGCLYSNTLDIEIK